MKAMTHYALALLTLAILAGSKAQAGSLPVYQYKHFCHNLSKGHAVMLKNCEAQEVLSYNQLRTIWQDPPSENIQEKCMMRNRPDPRNGSGSYVKYLNCIITNTGR